MLGFLATPQNADKTDNTPRFKSASGADHYESWFLRANDPAGRRALWLKATILRPRTGPPIAEAWCALFGLGTTQIGGDKTWAAKTTTSYESAEFTGDPLVIAIGQTRLELGPAGSGTGRVADPSGVIAAWDLSWRDAGGPLAAPLCMMPTRALVDSALPRNKLLTPSPSLRFSGWVELAGARVDAAGWSGMQGHNWGPAHAPSYAWGHCAFPDAAGSPLCVVEAFSGQIRVAGQRTPHFSALVVRRGDREWRFDTLVDLWRQDARIDRLDWTLAVRGPAGDATLAMSARPDEMVCLGYENPDGTLAYCRNSKLARCVLRVNPADDDGFVCISEHGGAFEVLGMQADPDFPVRA